MSRYAGLMVRGSLLLMESLWFYALIGLWIGVTVGGEKPTVLGVGAVVFLSFGISRALQNSSLDLGILRIWGMVLSLIVFYAIVRIDFYGDLRFWDLTFLDDLFYRSNQTLSAQGNENAVLTMPFLAMAWVRGVLRGQQSIEFDDVMRSFGLGVVIVALVAFASGVGADTPRAVDFIAIPYIAAGLLAIGLTHTARTSDRFERGFGKSWLAVAGGGLTLFGLVALVFVVVDLDTARELLGHAGKGVGLVFAGLLYVILWPILKVVELMFIATQFLIDLYDGTPNEPIADERGEIPTPEETAEREGDSPVPDWIGEGLRYIVAGGLIGGLLFWTARLFRRLQHRVQTEGERQSTYQEGRLAADLGDMLGSFFGRFRTSRMADGQTEPVRRLYFEMLDAAAARGVERRPVETPLELSPRIKRTIGGDLPDEITRVFDDTRYGAILPDATEVDRLRRAWDQRSSP